MSALRLCVLLALALSVVVGRASAQSPEPATSASRAEPVEAPRAELVEARRELVEARFEKALALLDPLLADPALPDPERLEALSLHSQAKVALGDLQAAEEDFRALLRLEPGFEPESGALSRKALERFRKLQSEMVGRVRLELDPPDARLLVDGRETPVGPTGSVALLSGRHELRAEAPGFDAFVHELIVEPSQDKPLRLALTPNARTVILRTEPDGVEVLVDGVVAGSTVRAAGGGAEPARLVLERLPLGEHVFELRRECYRSETRREILTADLLDRDAQQYATIVLQPARTTLRFEGGPRGAEVRIDDVAVGRLPLERHAVCPGRRRIEVRLEGRPLWVHEADYVEGAAEVLAVAPRPNVLLLGAETWPPGLSSVAGEFNVAIDARGDAPRDAEDPESWRGMTLPPGTDLVLARVAAAREGLVERWVVYSPVLRLAPPLTVDPREFAQPRWDALDWGLHAVDSVRHGPCVVIEVDAGGPAAAAGLVAGDRIERAGGRGVDGAAALAAAFAATSQGASETLEVEWRTAAGERRKATLVGTRGPALAVESGRPMRDAIVAAWARSDAAGVPARADTALARLGLLLGEHGQPALAADAWRRVGWPDRPGIGKGTAAYYLGRELLRAGDERGAIEALRTAAASRATAFEDAGPAVAPAAEDCLRDLGRAPSAR